ncbi:MAG TPA: Asp-tRNA(Asn)/Glu-tRNA(Gln) amidotransferase subunit GatB, partial [Vicinamibacterales bacterium]|nr:Asp-tRNA(Asn)/Glu-tRNA(Gln) amidotransferase subunit GatB [Vicinamibacterales bacterium]
AAADAAEFFERLRTILVWIGVNDGNMEEGSLRCDANVSVRLPGTEGFGTKAEVKNLNSFRFLQKALEFEIERQAALLREGDRVVQETRLFDAAAGATVSMRSKEEAHDYRYFPDPDLPPVAVSAERVAAIRAALPELPDRRRRRYKEQYALPAYDAEQLTASRAVGDFFEAVVREGAGPKNASNWIMGELARAMKTANADFASPPVAPGRLAALIRLIEQGTISSSAAKQVFEEMLASGRAAEDIVASRGLAQIDDDTSLSALVGQVLTEHAEAAAQYRGGRTATLGFLVGQVMKAAGGKANPRRVNDLLKQALAAGN